MPHEECVGVRSGNSASYHGTLLSQGHAAGILQESLLAVSFNTDVTKC